MRGCICGESVWSIDWAMTRDDDRPLDDCTNPRWMRCQLCAGLVRSRCGATREDRCQGCGIRHNRRLKRVLRSGFAGDRPEGFFFGTLTAPGVDGGMAWDEAECNHSEKLRCSGKLGCKADRAAAAVWNSYAPQAWSWFFTRLRELLPGVQIDFWGCWETQDRGLLHRHVLVRCPGVTKARFEAAWREAASSVYDLPGCRFAWGTQMDVQPIAAGAVGEILEVLSEARIEDVAIERTDASEATAFDLTGDEHQDEAPPAISGGDTFPSPEHGSVLSDDAMRATRYLAKYCTKGGARARTLNRETGELREGGYRPWSASRQWGDTMKAVRCRQRAYAMAQAADPSRAGEGGSPQRLGRLDSRTDFYVAHREAVALLEEIMGAVSV